MGDKEVIINGAVGEKEFTAIVTDIRNQLCEVKESVDRIEENISQRPCAVHEEKINQALLAAKVIIEKAPEIKLNTEFREKFTFTKILGMVVGVIAVVKGFEYLITLIKG